MIRTLLALALAASTLIVTPASASPSGPPAFADPECRYVLPPVPPAPPLSENIPLELGPVNGRNEGTTRSLGVRMPRWSVVGLRPQSTVDYDLKLFHCPDERVLGISAYSAGKVDFVALDGNRSWPAEPIYAKFYRYPLSAHGFFDAEYSTGGSPLIVGKPQTLALRGTPAVVRDLHVLAGTTVTVRLSVLSGSADLFLVDSGTDKTTWSPTRAQAIASSASAGPADEILTFTLPAGVRSETFGLVITNNADYGEFILTRS